MQSKYRGYGKDDNNNRTTVNYHVTWKAVTKSIASAPHGTAENKRVRKKNEDGYGREKWSGCRNRTDQKKRGEAIK